MASHAYERAMALTAPRPCCGAPKNEPDECAANAAAIIAAERGARTPTRGHGLCIACGGEVNFGGRMCKPCQREEYADAYEE